MNFLAAAVALVAALSLAGFAWRVRRVLEDEYRCLLLETNYGRLGGWIVEYEGVQVARLSAWRFSDMFWDEYTVTPLRGADLVGVNPLSAAFWGQFQRLTIWSLQFGDAAEGWFPAGALDTVENRPPTLRFRALYLRARVPTLADRVALRIRRMQGRGLRCDDSEVHILGHVESGRADVTPGRRKGRRTAASSVGPDPGRRPGTGE